MILNSPIISGSLTVTGNIITSGSITLSGSVASASYAASATSASYALNATTASYAVSATTASYADALTVAGTLTAQTLVVQTITSSVDFVTGSTRFGTLLTNTHVFSGSVTMNPGGLFVSSSGVVGVGTTSPSTKVHIYESATNGTAYLTIQNNRARNAAVYTATTSGGFYAGTSIGTDTFNYQIYDGVAGVSRITVDSVGNIGMGTSNPVATLPTGSSVLINNGWTLNSTIIASRKVLEINGNDNNGGNVGIFLRQPNKSVGLDIWSDNYYGNAYVDSRYDSADAYISFRLRTNTQANIVNAMVIKANGYVGIGTTNPSQKFEVVGGEIKAGRVDSSQEGGQVSFGRASDNNTTWYIDTYGSSTSPQLRFVNVDNSVVAMTLTGSNVGIGIANPTDTDGYGGKVLDVSGPGYFRDNSDNTKYVSIGSVSTIGFLEANGTGNYLRFYVGGNGEKARLTNSGYFKATSTSQTYIGSNGGYHEFYGGTANGYTLIVTSDLATPLSQYIHDLRFNVATPNNTSARFLNCGDATATRAYIRSNGGFSNYQANNTDLSDIRTKTDIIPIESYWDKFKTLEIVKYKYKDQTHDDYNIGVIAQQVEEVAPEFVDTDGWDKEDSKHH